MKKRFPHVPLAIAMTCGTLLPAKGAPPSWWTDLSAPVLVPNSRPDSENNHAIATVGQAKWMAKCALAALHATQPILADALEEDLVGACKPIPSWDAPSTPEEHAAMKAPLTVGQLKAIADPFYTWLHAFAPLWLDRQIWMNGTGAPGTFMPWSKPAFDDSNRAAATISQLKSVFSLRFEYLALDWDRDGLLDSEETITDIHQQDTDPYGYDIMFWWVDRNGFDIEAFDPLDDPDHDGLTNADEYDLKLDPHTADNMVAKRASLGTFTEVPVSRVGSVSFSNLHDAVVRHEEPTYSYKDWTWSPAVGITGVTFGNLNPESWDSAAWPDITAHDASGKRGIFSVNKGSSQAYYVLDPQLTTSNGGSTRIYDFIEGTVADKLKHAILDILPSPTGSSDVFSAYDGYTSNYAYNTNCWAYSLDLTGVVAATNQTPYDWTISPGNWFSQHSGTLITRRHIFFAHHFPYLVGAKVRFVSKTGTVHERTIMALNSDDSPLVTSDRSVAVLDSDLPSDICSYEIAGEWIRTRAPQVGFPSTPGYPWEQVWMGGVGFTINQWKRASIMPMGGATQTHAPVSSGTYNGVTYSNLNFFGQVVEIPSGSTATSPSVPDYFGPCLPYNELTTIGDSGSPFFVVVNGKPVLAWCWHDSVNGAALAGSEDVLNAMIASADAIAGVSTGYHVQVAASP